VVCPVTPRVPTFADDVYKFVEVAFVDDAFVATRLVVVVFTAVRLVVEALVM
jgi:hypothetical protein